jgi:predicted MFS family arabinose efflux permease
MSLTALIFLVILCGSGYLLGAWFCGWLADRAGLDPWAGVGMYAIASILVIFLVLL